MRLEGMLKIRPCFVIILRGKYVIVVSVIEWVRTQIVWHARKVF
jgi:hypothetical protein